MIEKRVETISDDGWKKIIEDFRKLHENEERMERQLELEEAQKKVKKAQKQTEEAQSRVNEVNQQVKRMIHKMYADGFSLEQISSYCSISVDEIQAMIKS